MDKQTQVLVTVLKLALGQPGEQRLFRSGKLPGVFAGRAGLNAEAAARAMREGLLEITRTETKGKTTTEWVRVTPRTIEFVHQHESPLQALRDLQAMLQMTQQGIPVWMGELRKDLQALADSLTQEAQRITYQIQALGQRVAQAIDRAQAGGPALPIDMESAVPWAPKVLEYLEMRKTTAAPGQCALPELFGALKNNQPELTLSEFHTGLRRLHDRKVLKLVPHDGKETLPEPEYALLDGSETFYHVGR